MGDASLNKPKACFLSAAGALILLAAWSVSTWHREPFRMDDDPPFSIAPGAFGSCPSEVQQSLRWGSDRSTGNRICCHNSRYAERAGYWLTTSFLTAQQGGEEVTFYDSVTGLPLFVAPRGRSWHDFVAESRAHGWPSFRDSEVVWSNVRVVSGGETVSVNGTHLGHNLPDGSGNRYCINIVCAAGSIGSASPEGISPSAIDESL